jgi:hypothetical protein
MHVLYGTCSSLNNAIPDNAQRQPRSDAAQGRAGQSTADMGIFSTKTQLSFP